MKKIIPYIILYIFLFSNYMIAQNRILPKQEVRTLEGEPFNVQKIDNKGNPTIISFWATWCKPCKKELNNIAEIYEDWQEETGVKIIAISIDDSRTISKVAPYVNSSDWEYEVYLDPNGDLKRAMGVSKVPHTFLLNGNNEIVWQHVGYNEGDEEKLYEEVLNIIEKK